MKLSAKAVVSCEGWMWGVTCKLTDMAVERPQPPLPSSLMWLLVDLNFSPHTLLCRLPECPYNMADGNQRDRQTDRHREMPKMEATVFYIT